LSSGLSGGCRLLVEHVEPGAEQLAGGKCCGHRLLVDHRAARGIDDDGRRFHRRQLTRADQVVCRGIERHMQRDDV